MIVTGYPSRGKSTFVDNLLINLSKRYGLKHLIASFESVSASHYNSLLEMYLQKTIFKIKQQDKEQAQSDIFGSGYEFLSEHFYRFDTSKEWDIDSICERTELAVRKYGINTLVIDPYNRLKNDYNDREDKYIGSILSKLSMLAKKKNNLPLVIDTDRMTGFKESGQGYDITFGDETYYFSLEDAIYMINQLFPEDNIKTIKTQNKKSF